MENLKWKENKIRRNKFLLFMVLFLAIIVASCYGVSKKEPVYETYTLIACYKQYQGSEKRGFSQYHYCDFKSEKSEEIREVLYKPYAYDEMLKYQKGTKVNLENYSPKNIWISINLVLVAIFGVTVLTILVVSGTEGKWCWEEGE